MPVGGDQVPYVLYALFLTEYNLESWNFYFAVLSICLFKNWIITDLTENSYFLQWSMFFSQSRFIYNNRWSQLIGMLTFLLYNLVVIYKHGVIIFVFFFLLTFHKGYILFFNIRYWHNYITCNQLQMNGLHWLKVKLSCTVCNMFMIILTKTGRILVDCYNIQAFG